MVGGGGEEGGGGWRVLPAGGIRASQGTFSSFPNTFVPPLYFENRKRYFNETWYAYKTE